MKFKFGLQAQFLLLMSLGLTVILLMLSILMRHQEALLHEVTDASNHVIEQVIDRRVRANGVALSGQLATLLAGPMRDAEWDRVHAIASGFSEQSDLGIRYLQIYDRRGEPLPADTTHAGVQLDLVAPGLLPISATQAIELRQRNGVLDIVAPVLADGERVGSIRLGLAAQIMNGAEREALATLEQRLRATDLSNRRWLLLLMGGLVAAGALSTFYIQYVLVAPLRKLAAAARKMETGKYEIGKLVSRRPDELGELMTVFGHMSQSIARHDREVRKMAYTDPLTGLLNRLAFCERLELRLGEARNNGEELALLFTDVDEFKRVNDILGHEAGDLFLLEFAKRICAVVNADEWSNTALARFGGDEFVILIQGHDIRAKAERLAHLLIEEMQHPLSIQDKQIFLGISIGIALYPIDGMESVSLLKNGDTAMYQAKFSGKNGYRFYNRMIDLATERLVRLEQELRGAWERGEISVSYQGIMDVQSNRVAGAEALLRWSHPVLGEIEPETFISAAERIGMIESIGLHVMREACAEAMRWNGADGDDGPFVSVNVSSYQLLNDDLPNQVRACLAETGLPPSRLHLELTETSVLEDEQHIAGLFAQLKQIGVEIWLDDFGTGFSRFNQLRHASIDGIKIDRSFVTEMRPDTGDWTLVSTMISMANSLGIRVIAEGVEREPQHDFLKQLGCHMEQGFWLSEPVGADDFRALLQRMRT